MAKTTVPVRIPAATYQILRELAGEDSMQSVIEQAVEDLRRKRLLEQTNAAFAALRADPDAWSHEVAERADWETTLADGQLGD